MGTKQFSNYESLITFTRASGGHALRPVSYGDELVTNGTFDSDTSNWTDYGDSTLSVVSGELNVTNNSTGYGYASQAVTTEVGKLYKFNFDFNHLGTTGHFRLGTTLGADDITSSNLYSDQNVEHIFVATTTTVYIRVGNQANTAGHDAQYDNISVKEVTFDQPDGTLTLFEHPNNVPRVEYDADGNRLGLLVEESRTNLIPWSNAFSQWTLTRATITENVAISPDGTQNATLFTATDDDARLQYAAGDINIINTASIWVKSATGSDVSVQMDNGGLDIDTFTANSEWQRLENVLSTTGVANPRCRLRIINSGDAVYVYHGQLEAGSFMTSAISTTGSTATRSADVASIPVADFGFNADEGSVVIESQHFTTESSVSAAGFALDDGSSSNRMYYYQNKAQWIVSVSGTTTVSIDDSDPAESTLTKAGVTYKENDFASNIDGSLVGSDTSSGVPTVTTLHVGRSSAGTALNGHIKSIKYYPRRLTNAQLQDLTS